MAEPLVDTGASPAASPPAATVDSSTILSSLSQDQLADWNKTGKLPDATRPASSTGPSGTQSPSTDGTAAASEPATPKEDKPRERPNVKTRNADLDADIADLRTRLATRKALREELDATSAKPDATPAASSTAQPTDEEWKRFAQHPDAPQADEFPDSYDDFIAARAAFIAGKVFDARQERAGWQRESEQRLAAIGETINEFHKHLDAAEAADPAFLKKVNPALLEIAPAFAVGPKQPVLAHNAIMQEIIRSPHAAQLLLHFSTDEGVQEWQGMLRKPAAELLKTFGRIEARFESTGKPGGTAPLKTVTDAPAPPQTLGRKPAQPADSAEGAIKAGDFSAYERIANQRDLAARR